MTNRSSRINLCLRTQETKDIVRPGMMGEGTAEQSLNERGNPAARITEYEVKDAFGPKTPKVP